MMPPRDTPPAAAIEHPNTLPPVVTNASAEAKQPATNYVDTHQPLVVGTLAFLIGIFTVGNAVMATLLSERNRRKDAALKKVAFFSILEADVEESIEALKSSLEIVQALDLEDVNTSSWIRSLRVSSRLTNVRPVKDDWDKLAVIGKAGIKALRRYNNCISELNELFQHVLDDPEMIRGGALPLFEKYQADVDREDARDQLVLQVTQIEESLVDAKEGAESLLKMCMKELGEKDGLGFKKESR